MNDASPEMMSIFCAALERLSAQERAAYLETACGRDMELRARLEALLQAHDQAGGFLPEKAEVPETHASVAHPSREGPATVIGPYKLLQQLGEGGMGTVFLAEQTQPVQRKVALKIIKAGMDSRQVIARFEAERQALALMDHPNIAKVFDAGTTATGQPYFVMELVKGVPITRYCDEHRLTPRERLELFVPVCQAVQHAHQKGIIHRDIKPSNVLVAVYDDKPVPKVIDFGIAKATGQQLTERTLCTDIGQVVGTLEYMSPEQAGLNQLDIDTRSDIYSLGVLLYELLTGSTPLEGKRLRAAALLEMLRLIREEEPPKPSTRLSATDELPSVAANRGQEPKQLSGQVRGELDWIVMKSLEKDRNRRYETANGFAQDIQRYLADEAVQACPPSAWYRFRKFSRRNKTGLTAAGLVLVALVLGTGISTWQAIRATRAVDAERQTRVALDSAREEKEKQQTRINRELTESLVEAARLREKARARPGDAGPWSQLREVLGAAQTLAGHELADPVLGGRVQALLAELKQDDNDRRMVARLEEIRLQLLKPEGAYWYAGARRPVYEAAFREYGLPIFDLAVEEAARRIQTSAVRDWLVAALDDCANNDSYLIARLLPIAQQGETDPWRKQYFAARLRNDYAALVRLARQPEALAQPPTIVCMLAVRVGSPDRTAAIALLRAVQWRYPADLWINRDLAFFLTSNISSSATPERPVRVRAEAVSCCRAALAVRPESRSLWQTLGLALLHNGDYADAADLFREVIRLWPDHCTGYNGLGQVLESRNDWDGAITLYRKSLGLSATASTLAGLDSDLAGTYGCLGRALGGKGDLDGAITAYRKATTLAPWNRSYFYLLGRALRSRGDLDGAIANFRKIVAEGPGGFSAKYELSQALWDRGDFAEAIATYEEIVKVNPKHDTAFDNLAWWLATCPEVKFRNPARAVELAGKAVALNSHVFRSWITLGVAQYRADDYKGAVATLTKMDGRPGRVAGLFLAMAHHKLGNREQAHKSFDVAIRWLGTFSDAEIRFRSEAEELLKDYPEIHYSLGYTLSAKGQLGEAVAEYREAIRLKKDYPEAHCNLGDCLRRQGEFGKALEELRRGHELGSKNPRWPYSSALWVRQCERLVELEGKLPGILEGKTAPANPGERIVWAGVCYLKRVYGAAARFYADAFAADPKLADDLKAGHRYKAACCAALTAASPGANAGNLDDQEQSRLRHQALAWLRADLDLWSVRLTGGKAEDRPVVWATLQRWQSDADLSGVREVAALKKLTDNEQAAWRKLWADVAEVHKNAGNAK